MSPQFSSAPYLYLDVELSDPLPLKIGPLLRSRPLGGKILGTAGAGGSSGYVLLSLVNKETALAF